MNRCCRPQFARSIDAKSWGDPSVTDKVVERKDIVGLCKDKQCMLLGRSCLVRSESYLIGLWDHVFDRKLYLCYVNFHNILSHRKNPTCSSNVLWWPENSAAFSSLALRSRQIATEIVLVLLDVPFKRLKMGAHTAPMQLQSLLNAACSLDASL